MLKSLMTIMGLPSASRYIIFDPGKYNLELALSSRFGFKRQLTESLAKFLVEDMCVR